MLEVYELPQNVLKTLKQYLRVALGLNPMTVSLHTLTALLEKGGRALVDIRTEPSYYGGCIHLGH